MLQADATNVTSWDHVWLALKAREPKPDIRKEDMTKDSIKLKLELLTQ